MDKSPDAFRTISEAAEELDLPQHVLRFWETRFPQIKPLKRGGGRRYYRPDDVQLLKGIRHLLYDQGFTIKGVQRILKDQGTRHVAAIGETGNIRPIAPARAEDAEPAPPQRAEPAFEPADPPEIAYESHPAPRRDEPVEGTGAAEVRRDPEPQRVEGLDAHQRERLESVLRTLEQCRDQLDRGRGA